MGSGRATLPRALDSFGSSAALETATTLEAFQRANTDALWSGVLPRSCALGRRRPIPLELRHGHTVYLCHPPPTLLKNRAE